MPAKTVSKARTKTTPAKNGKTTKKTVPSRKSTTNRAAAATDAAPGLAAHQPGPERGGEASYCRACGKATRPLPGAMHRQCSNPACHAMDWVNPVPAVGLAFVRDGHVLLSRRASDPNRGQWDLIGGFMEASETPEQAFEREILEETGCALGNLLIVDVQPGAYGDRPTLNFLATGELIGTPRPHDDVVELHFHPLDRLPMLAWPHEAAFLAELAARAPH